MAADLNSLVIAYSGRRDLLQSIFGAPVKKGPPTGGGGKPVVLTPASFDAMFIKE